MKKVSAVALGLTLLFAFTTSALAGPGETNAVEPPKPIVLYGPGETN